MLAIKYGTMDPVNINYLKKVRLSEEDLKKNIFVGYWRK
jgi:hypothetical protein